MKKYIVSLAIPMAILSLAIAFFVPIQKTQAQTTNCPAGYTCTPIVQTVTGCPVGYTCTPVAPTATVCYTFSRNLGVGSYGQNVQQLTSILTNQGFLNGSKNQYNETVAAAVTNFQNKYASDILTPNGLSNGTGYVGLATRTKLNQLCNPGNTSNPVNSLLSYNGTTDTGVNFSLKYPSTWTYYKLSCNADILLFWPKNITPNFSTINCGLDNTATRNFKISVSIMSNPQITLADNTYQSVYNQMLASLVIDSGTTPTPTPSPTPTTQTTGDITGPAKLSTNQTGTWTISNQGGNVVYGVDWQNSSGFNVDNYQRGIIPNTQNSNVFTHSFSSSGIYTVQFYAKNIATNTMIPLVDSSVTVRVGVPDAPIVSSISPTHGRIGTTITIYGSNFTQTGNNISFGQHDTFMSANASASNVSSASGTTLSFVIPSTLFQPSQITNGSYISTAPGVYNIGVSNANGRSVNATNPVLFTIDQ